MLLPAPLSPTRATVSPGRSSRSTPSRTGSRAGVRERDGLEPDGDDARARGRRVPGGARRPLLEQVEEAARDGEAVGARVVLRREVPERQVELGREHEHRQARLEPEPALDQPDADDHGDEGDAEGRGQLEHGPREERDAERPHRRAAVAVTDLGDPLGLRLCPVERAERRQPADDVEEVGRETRQGLPALTRSPLGVPADQPHEDRDERQRQEHDTGGDRVDHRHEDEHGDRHHHGQHDLRQVAREGRLERVDASDGDRRHLGALGPVETCWAVAEPSLDDVEAELGEHVGRGAPARDLEPPRGRRARDGDEREQDQRLADLGERGTVERARHDACEQHRLGEDEERGDDAEHDIRGEEDAHRASPPQETRVDRSHGAPSSRSWAPRGRSGCRGPRRRAARGTRGTSTPGRAARPGGARPRRPSSRRASSAPTTRSRP